MWKEKFSQKLTVRYAAFPTGDNERERGVAIMMDIIVIGAGCAGLTAAVYAVRAGLSVLVLEKGLYGGQIAITDTVENYPSIEKISGYELAENIYKQAIHQGVRIVFEEVVSVQLEGGQKTVTTSSHSYSARAVIIANGVKRRKLECEGEKELTGKGVSYCATCDGAFFRGKEVAVVGGGNTALEDALFLSNLCKKVTMLLRGKVFRGEYVLQRAAARRKNIEVLYETTVLRMEGEQQLERLVIRRKGQDTEKILDVSAAFIAIGLIPENRLFCMLEQDEHGYLIADENCRTRIPEVYAAGDTRSKLLRQIITAAADGAVAAFQAANAINRSKKPLV